MPWVGNINLAPGVNKLTVSTVVLYGKDYDVLYVASNVIGDSKVNE